MLFIAFIPLQLSQHVQQENEYGLNINSDVELWLDSRAYQKRPSLQEACGFVIMNSELHDEFDQFKMKEAYPDYSLLQHIELLDFWLRSKKLLLPTVSKFGKQYVRLHHTEVDSLCRWVLKMREKSDIIEKTELEKCNFSACFLISTIEESEVLPISQDSQNGPKGSSLSRDPGPTTHGQGKL